MKAWKIALMTAPLVLAGSFAAAGTTPWVVVVGAAAGLLVVQLLASRRVSGATVVVNGSEVYLNSDENSLLQASFNPLNGKIVADDEWEQLPADERAAVIAHEMGHAQDWASRLAPLPAMGAAALAAVVVWAIWVRSGAFGLLLGVAGPPVAVVLAVLAKAAAKSLAREGHRVYSRVVLLVAAALLVAAPVLIVWTGGVVAVAAIVARVVGTQVAYVASRELERRADRFAKATGHSEALVRTLLSQGPGRRFSTHPTTRERVAHLV